MLLRHITEAEVRLVVADPDQVIDGTRVHTKNYYRVVGDRPLAVVLGHSSEPPIVVTVMLDLHR